jgi:hypothetical protein
VYIYNHAAQQDLILTRATMSDILRTRYVELLDLLTDHDYICGYLYQHNVFTRGVLEDILNQATSHGKTRLLVDMIRRKFHMAFDLFCTALENTHQRELVGLLDPERTPKDMCVLCMKRPSKIVFIPCAEICVCEHCGDGLTQCPLCKTNITHRFRVYY